MTRVSNSQIGYCSFSSLPLPLHLLPAERLIPPFARRDITSYHRLCASRVAFSCPTPTPSLPASTASIRHSIAQPHELLQSERGLSVLLEAGRRLRLDPTNPRSVGYVQILEGLRQQRLLAYLELDPSTGHIARLLIPHITRVIALSTGDDNTLQVGLAQSHARHVLRPDGPDYALLAGQLRDALASRAPLIVTEDDAHTIIDVRAFVPGPDRPAPPWLDEPPPTPAGPLLFFWRGLKRLWCWRHWPWRCWRCISLTRAQAVFNTLSATTCNPLTVPPPCIPFLYPDDGCWGRAHEMCRLMIAMGLMPQKVWIRGNLHTLTRNNPNCYVDWGWHVAPTLCVRSRRFYKTEPMVMDPALFQEPVSKPTWQGVQGDPTSTLTDSAASVFYLWSNETDPTYSKTNQVLATYRLQLQLRSINVGPPPYAFCP